LPDFCATAILEETDNSFLQFPYNNFMNKFAWIFAVLTIVLFGVIAYFQLSNTSAKNEPNTAVSTETHESTESMSVPNGSYTYNISEGSASYTALKKFFTKPEQYVTGTTEEVTGNGWFNSSDGSGYVKVLLNIDSIKTDNAKRDTDVQDLFSDHTVVFIANIPASDIKIDQPFEKEIPGNLTLNGITKDVIFKVSGTVNEADLIALGSTTVKMSDFAINPPSLAGVFTADDNLELKFDIKANQ
jgi:polyisoprenoid-binding protein YceI